MAFGRTAILGVGLIGASIAGALKQRKLTGHVAGFGRKEENLRKAKKLGFIDSYSLDPARVCDGADLVVFATPVETFAQLARTVSGSLKHGALVIDVGSVKNIVYDMEGLMPPGTDFVGCHPIAGSERSGVEASSPELFEGALCIITRTPGTAVEGVEKAAGLWRAMGSEVEFLGPEEHDIIYGLVSHLPHLAAYAIVNTAGEADDGCLRFAGPGFMDTTRIALGSPELWSNICLLNRDNLLRFIEMFKGNLDSLSLCLKGGDREGLQRAFQKARRLRESIGD